MMAETIKPDASRNLHVDLLATVFAPLASGAVKTLGTIFQMVEPKPAQDGTVHTQPESPAPPLPQASLLCAFADAAVHAMVTGLAKQMDNTVEIGPNPRKTAE